MKLKATWPLAIALATAWSGTMAQDVGLVSQGDQVVEIVHQRFYNAAQAAAWAETHAHYARNMEDGAAFVQKSRKILAELNASHTGYYTPEDVEFYALRAIFQDALNIKDQDVPIESIGVDSRPDGFVRRIFLGGPASQTDLQRGDRILLCDDRPFHPVQSLKGKDGLNLRLTVQKTPDGPLRIIEVRPRRIDPRQEWLTHQNAGTQIMATPAGHHALYVPYYCGAGEKFTVALEATIQERQGSADLMILDARGGWGGSPPDLIARFDQSVPTLELKLRGGESKIQTAWRKPLIVLTDGGTRSGKEVFAAAVKASQRGKLVGQPTAGAVLAGSPFLLNDGALLLLAVGDILVDGQRIEGVGVLPNLLVPDPLPFSQGLDAIFNAALGETDAILKAGSGGIPQP